MKGLFFPSSRRLVVAALAALALGGPAHRLGAAIQVADAPPHPSDPISLVAARVQNWREGRTEVLLCDGPLYIAQGLHRIWAQRAVIWMTSEPAVAATGPAAAAGGTHLVVYTEGKVLASLAQSTVEEEHFGLELRTQDKFLLSVTEPAGYRRLPEAPAVSELLVRAKDWRDSKPPDPAPLRGNPDGASASPVQQAGYQTSAPTLAQAGPANAPGAIRVPSPANAPAPGAAAPAAPKAPAGKKPPRVPPPTSGPQSSRRIQGFPRNTIPFQSHSYQFPNGEQAILIWGGIDLIINNAPTYGTIDVQADRMVLWTRNTDEKLPDAGNQAFSTTQRAGTPLELYLEGHVIILQNERRIEATQMYLDVNKSVGLILNGQIEVFNPKLQTPVFLRGDLIRQVSRDKFITHQGTFTTSTFGVPGYALVSKDAVFTDEEKPQKSWFGRPVIDPKTGQQAVEPNRTVTSYDNIFRIEDIPVFYWPVFQADLENPNIPLQRFAIRNDSIFGTQVLSTWDTFSLLGLKHHPKGIEWTFDLDYLSSRGFAAGTDVLFSRTNAFGIPGATNFGDLFAFGLPHDAGKDVLGIGPDIFGHDRKSIAPETRTRGDFQFRDTAELPGNLSVTVEAAEESDRNFREEYFKHIYDTDKDPETLLYVKQQEDSWAWTALVRPRLLDWQRETEYLPRLDGYLEGVPLWENRLTFFNRTSLSYARYLPSDEDKLVSGPATRIPANEVDAGRFISLNELDYPFQVGPFKFVPYLIGMASGYTQDLDRDPFGRLYAAAGMRASVPFWRTFPTVQDELLNVHGLAHKVTLSVDAMSARATSGMFNVPEFEELDEDPQEAYRRRFIKYEFGGVLPLRFDPRIYALRDGVMTNPEVLDDLDVVRFDINQRLQTKRGQLGQMHIIDWMRLDIQGAFFPNPGRDNFGQRWGLLKYDYEWHVGDRTTLVSDAFWDTFKGGGKVFNIGLAVDRPPRGNLYLGYRFFQGPANTSVIIANYSYTMSPKWIMNLLATFDVTNGRNLGETIGLTRIGSDFLMNFGLAVNPERRDFGLSFEIAPRFMPRLGLGSMSGPRQALPLNFAPTF